MQVTNIKFILVSVIIGLFIAMGFGIVENSSAGGIEGLVGGWLFDEGVGKVAKDISGNGHDGEVINAKWVEGKFNKALEFGPSDSYVRVKHHQDLDLKIYTVAAWVKCDKQATYQTILTKTNGQRNYGMFVKPNDGNIHFNLHDEADTRIDSQKTVDDNQWHYCVMTVEKETLSGYIDGEKEEKNCGEPAFSTADVTIGAGGDGTRFWMMGSIDEPAIFNRVLDEVEMKELMSKGLAGILQLEAKDRLVTCWGSIKNQ
jgi:hypothetical protein